MKSVFYVMALAGALFLGSPNVYAGIDNLLPLPKRVVYDRGALRLGQGVKITDPTGCQLLRDILAEAGCDTADGATRVDVSLVDSIPGQYDYDLAGYDNEAYRLRVTAGGVEIEAVTGTGVIRAAQTLGQLMESDADGTLADAIPLVEITDWPAFKLRGYMHDVGRSFIEPETLKRHLRLLSRFKVNTFHWHMTENQAWRFEVKAYPELTSAGSMTRFPGKYYTQEQIREVIAEARRCGVTIIPEIDMPGHSEAFERAMGCEMQSPRGKEILLTVLEEVAALFDLEPYIHIGADEKTITDPTFLPAMTAKVHSLGKKVVCWNPIRGVAIGPTSGFDMTQMWSTAGRAISGMPNIDCRYNYTNHFDVFADLAGIYMSNIYYADKGSAELAGTISAPWNDRLTLTEEDIIRQNNFYANVLASAERAWKGGGEEYIETGGTTLPVSGPVYDEFADWERRFLFHKSASLSGEPIPYVRQTNVRWMITDPFPNGGNASMSFPPETALAPQYEYDGASYGASPAVGAAVYLRHTWGTTVPSFYPVTYDPGHTAYAYTWVYSPTARRAGALIEFQNYSRSEKDAAPDHGEWDRKGSRIWLNDSPIEPPVWDNSGVAVTTNEVPLRNENFTARKPTAVSLRAGWNKVLIKLPYVNAPGVRLNKWLFTFVITDLDGRDAMPDLIYSPSRSFSPEAEILAGRVNEVRAFVNAEVRDLPGYYAGSDASRSLEALADQIEATLGEDLPAATRSEQLGALDAAFAAFRSSYRQAGMARPHPGAGYYLSTPLRGGRYLTSAGAGQGVMGEASPSGRGAWLFNERPDGSFDIVNYSDGSFLSPDAAFNTQVTTAATAASRGWRILPADATGYAIIATDTGAQLNQTNAGLGWKIYNWGNGTNITDTGCKYQFAESPFTGLDDVASESPFEVTSGQGWLSTTGPATVYDLRGRALVRCNGHLPILPGLYIVTDGRLTRKVSVL